MGDSMGVPDPGLASSFLVTSNTNILVSASPLQGCFLGLTQISFPGFRTFFQMES